MSIDIIKESIQDYAKDTRINIGNVLNPEISTGLSEKQIYGCALSVAITLNNHFLTKQLLSASQNLLTEQDMKGIKTAVSLMAMNNIYYRSIHLAEDEELSKRPAGLRMTMMASSGIDAKDFEIYSLALSTVTGCGMCIKSHTAKLKSEGLSVEGLQSIIKIAAVIHATHKSLLLKKIEV